jgi:hypothetical protein
MDGGMMEMTEEAILERIDTISRELRELPGPAPGPLVATPQARQSAENLAEELFGILGQGSWDEYDEQLDSKRFVS